MRTHIFVAGVDYEFKGVNFRLLCDNRRKRAEASNTKHDELRFITFDVRKGEVETREVTFPKGKRSESVTADTTTFAGVSKANYNKTRTAKGEDHYTFKNRQPDVMSIVHVYNSLCDIGDKDPHTVREFSIFSHGWMGGPILVNSFIDNIWTVSIPDPFGGPPTDVDLPLPSSIRDPDDKDGRGELDFDPPVMSAARLTNFHDAFDSDGFAWLWGCSFPRRIHGVFSKMLKGVGYKSSGLADTDKVKLDLDTDNVDVLRMFLPGVVPLSAAGKKTDLAFSDLKQFFCLAISSTYAFVFATKVQVKAFAAGVGTYADYDTGVKLPLMHVFQTGFGGRFKFFENYMKLKFDPEGRHYAEHLPTFTCPIP